MFGIEDVQKHGKQSTDVVMGEILRRGVLAPERQHGGASEVRRIQVFVAQ